MALLSRLFDVASVNDDVAGDLVLDERASQFAREFREEEHPRAEDGKFDVKEGRSSIKEKESSEELETAIRKWLNVYDQDAGPIFEAMEGLEGDERHAALRAARNSRLETTTLTKKQRVARTKLPPDEWKAASEKAWAENRERNALRAIKKAREQFADTALRAPRIKATTARLRQFNREADLSGAKLEVADTVAEGLAKSFSDLEDREIDDREATTRMRSLHSALSMMPTAVAERIILSSYTHHKSMEDVGKAWSGRLRKGAQIGGFYAFSTVDASGKKRGGYLHSNDWNFEQVIIHELGHALDGKLPPAGAGEKTMPSGAVISTVGGNSARSNRLSGTPEWAEAYAVEAKGKRDNPLGAYASTTAVEHFPEMIRAVYSPPEEDDYGRTRRANRHKLREAQLKHGSAKTKTTQAKWAGKVKDWEHVIAHEPKDPTKPAPLERRRVMKRQWTTLATKMPKSWAFFKKNGLLPDDAMKIKPMTKTQQMISEHRDEIKAERKALKVHENNLKSAERPDSGFSEAAQGELRDLVKAVREKVEARQRIIKDLQDPMRETHAREEEPDTDPVIKPIFSEPVYDGDQMGDLILDEGDDDDDEPVDE